MNRLLKLEKKNSSLSSNPQWLCDATSLQKKLFEKAKKQFEEKKAAIEAGNASEGKSRKIVAADVAAAANCDKSNISIRKNPDLHQWIANRSDELMALAQSKRQTTVSRRKTSEEIRKENERLKKQALREKNLDYATIAEALLGNTLTEAFKNTSAELAELRSENQSLRNQLAELREANKKLIKSINIPGRKI